MPHPSLPLGSLGREDRHLNFYELWDNLHRAVKQRYYPMLGFGGFESAARFCSAFDELRQYFGVRRCSEGHVSLAEQRRPFLTRWRPLISELAAAQGGRQRETLSWVPSVT
jgi:hypothetical protein